MSFIRSDVIGLKRSDIERKNDFLVYFLKKTLSRKTKLILSSSGAVSWKNFECYHYLSWVSIVWTPLSLQKQKKRAKIIFLCLLGNNFSFEIKGI